MVRLIEEAITVTITVTITQSHGDVGSLIRLSDSMKPTLFKQRIFCEHAECGRS
jgi:hypothetical protein